MHLQIAAKFTDVVVFATPPLKFMNAILGALGIVNIPVILIIFHSIKALNAYIKVLLECSATCFAESFPVGLRVLVQDWIWHIGMWILPLIN